ncbi:hypothetical protein DAEQUDRAFT_710861 [Daedalea quercina L-15889]|uniref:Phospholipid/glycerol acyltransferase domain-containing protein n=1 Tax=Daedalea quercina L-15889 TaxID=1314783 RepID=A0A165Q412_9APHY|nr:hypothetical protein DAEQUDRAFT_710861 [Daedalea quercina L-15889]
MGRGDTNPTISSDFLYAFAMFLWRTAVSIFFREVRPRGAFHIPQEGPVIFVAAPHNNQFVDMVLALEVWRETRRKVQFLVAAKSMKQRVIGFFARMLASIPVVRAADEAKPGMGFISLSEDDPTLVVGHGTQFTKELSPRMQIMLPKSVSAPLAEVLEVISDRELRLKKEFSGDSGKSTLKVRQKVSELQTQGQPGLEFKRIPHIDQQDMYHHVYQCLTEGGCIGIFPEGGSHDRADLLPLKAGVSLMALGAMANNPSLKVQIVPVGLSYFHPHRFRSRVVVEFGTAFEVPEELVALYNQGGAEKRRAVGQLLNLIYDALKIVTVRAPDYDTLMLCQAARRLYEVPGQHTSLGQVIELNRRFLEGYLHFKDEPKVKRLRDDVLKYNRMVRDLGLRDHQVPRAQKASWKTLGLLVYRLGLLAVWSVLALPGVVLNAPIFLAALAISRKKAREALAGSVVKISGRDVMATWKILISLGLTPVLYGFYAFLATIVAIKAGAPFKWQIYTPVLVMVILPFVAYAALKFGEAGMDVLKSLPPLIVTLVPGQSRSFDRLKAMRVQVTNELVEVVNEFAPILYDDFDERRMLLSPISRPDIYRRRSSGAVPRAQGTLLVHPMTWLDEHLFGWSPSSSRGTSALSGDQDESGGGTLSEDEETDEEHGDYDNVLGYLERRGAESTRPRSCERNGSYADLQRLRNESREQFSGAALASVRADGVSADADGIPLRRRADRKEDPSVS